MVSGHAEIECPFCKKADVEAVHKPSHLEPKATHVSAGSKTVYYCVPESYDTVSGCPACGKTVKEVGRTLETGITREVAYEERLWRPERAGCRRRLKASRARQRAER
jgi:endogenous inhibitor of DNA gyrase (YacG/DUF329 family)